MTPPKFEELSKYFAELADRELKAYQEKSGLKVKLDARWLSRLREAYEDNTKTAIKQYTKTGQNTRLDRHKIAAALLVATLQAHPFVMSTQDSVESSRYREATVFLAIHIGCIVIILFGITEANLTENSDLGNAYKSNNEELLNLPTGNGDGKYIGQLVKAINFARQADGPIPYGYALLLSHIFFLLQCSFERRRCMQLGIDPDSTSMDIEKRMRDLDALAD